MNNLAFYIGLGLGLGVTAGLRPFLPALLAGALASGGALGLGFAHSGYSFLQAGWWLVALTVALVAAYLLQLRLGAERFQDGPLGAALAGVGIGLGALLFAGTLGEHGDASWPGLIGGAAAAVIGQGAIRPLLARTRARLPDRGAREALTIYVDMAALLLAGATALLHPLGYVVLALFLWLVFSARRRSGEKYAGLRILGR
jgi:Domain of unknown function (DUF4126)